MILAVAAPAAERIGLPKMMQLDWDEFELLHGMPGLHIFWWKTECFYLWQHCLQVAFNSNRIKRALMIIAAIILSAGFEYCCML